MTKDNSDIIKTYKNKIPVGRYSLSIKSVQTHWKGYDSGKMEDMPGDFFESFLYLNNIRKPNTLEKLAIDKKVCKLSVPSLGRKEITDEPEGYAKLLHNERTKILSKEKESYFQSLVKTALKNKL